MSGSRGRRSCTKHVSYSEPVAKFEEEVESDEDSKELSDQEMEKSSDDEDEQGEEKNADDLKKFACGNRSKGAKNGSRKGSSSNKPSLRAQLSDALSGKKRKARRSKDNDQEEDDESSGEENAGDEEDAKVPGKRRNKKSSSKPPKGKRARKSSGKESEQDGGNSDDDDDDSEESEEEDAPSNSRRGSGKASRSKALEEMKRRRAKGRASDDNRRALELALSGGGDTVTGTSSGKDAKAAKSDAGDGSDDAEGDSDEDEDDADTGSEEEESETESSDEEEEDGKSGNKDKRQARKALRKKVEQAQQILNSRRVSGKTEYLCKFRDVSYRKLEWIEGRMLKDERRSLVSAYHGKLDKGKAPTQVNDYENGVCPEWIRIERVVAAKGGDGTRDTVSKYLVKWEVLGYQECTWEPAEELTNDEDAPFVDAFWKREKASDKKASPASPQVLTELLGSGKGVPDFLNGRKLRDYQIESFKWMVQHALTNSSCILGDEMGLGKTAQSIAVLEFLRVKARVRDPMLIVAPLTTLGHWRREIETWTNMNVICYMGGRDDRAVIDKHELWKPRQTGQRSKKPKFDVILTSFEILRDCGRLFESIAWSALVVDEAHRLKNIKSAVRQSIRALEARFLLLLTGTPIQNNMSELFSIMNLVDEEKFPKLEEFLTRFGDPVPTPEQLADLQECLRPILLRRMKEDVETLPEKEEVIIWVELTTLQREYYKSLYEKDIASLLTGVKASALPGMRNLAMELRKLCCHPFLCNGIEDDMIMRLKAVNGREPSRPEALEAASGKLLLVRKLLTKLRSEKRRVLIFSQFKIMLDILEEMIEEHLQMPYERLDGDTKGQERQAAMDRFQNGGDDVAFAFLLSTKAGGQGITLTAADTIVLYDSDWNPQNDLQAMARAHRIGQTNEVTIYRLVTKNTYEESLINVANRKGGLNEAILGNLASSNSEDPHENAAVISRLLKEGAHSLLGGNEEEAKESAKKFESEDIGDILAQRTSKRIMRGGGKAGGGTFSVANFKADDGSNGAAAGEGADFWRALLPDAVKAAELAEQNRGIVSGPRRRRAINYNEDKIHKDAEEKAKAESNSGSSEYSQSGEEEDDDDDDQEYAAEEIPKNPTDSTNALLPAQRAMKQPGSVSANRIDPASVPLNAAMQANHAASGQQGPSSKAAHNEAIRQVLLKAQAESLAHLQRHGPRDIVPAYSDHVQDVTDALLNRFGPTHIDIVLCALSNETLTQSAILPNHSDYLASRLRALMKEGNMPANSLRKFFKTWIDVVRNCTSEHSTLYPSAVEAELRAMGRPVPPNTAPKQFPPETQLTHDEQAAKKGAEGTVRRLRKRKQVLETAAASGADPIPLPEAEVRQLADAERLSEQLRLKELDMKKKHLDDINSFLLAVTKVPWPNKHVSLSRAPWKSAGTIMKKTLAEAAKNAAGRLQHWHSLDTLHNVLTQNPELPIHSTASHTNTLHWNSPVSPQLVSKSSYPALPSAIAAVAQQQQQQQQQRGPFNAPALDISTALLKKAEMLTRVNRLSSEISAKAHKNMDSPLGKFVAIKFFLAAIQKALDARKDEQWLQARLLVALLAVGGEPAWGRTAARANVESVGYVYQLLTIKVVERASFAATDSVLKPDVAFTKAYGVGTEKWAIQVRDAEPGVPQITKHVWVSVELAQWLQRDLSACAFDLLSFLTREVDRVQSKAIHSGLPKLVPQQAPPAAARLQAAAGATQSQASSQPQPQRPPVATTASPAATQMSAAPVATAAASAAAASSARAAAAPATTARAGAAPAAAPRPAGPAAAAAAAAATVTAPAPAVAAAAAAAAIAPVVKTEAGTTTAAAAAAAPPAAPPAIKRVGGQQSAPIEVSSSSADAANADAEKEADEEDEDERAQVCAQSTGTGKGGDKEKDGDDDDGGNSRDGAGGQKRPRDSNEGGNSHPRASNGKGAGAQPGGGSTSGGGGGGAAGPAATNGATEERSPKKRSLEKCTADPLKDCKSGSDKQMGAHAHNTEADDKASSAKQTAVCATAAQMVSPVVVHNENSGVAGNSGNGEAPSAAEAGSPASSGAKRKSPSLGAAGCKGSGRNSMEQVSKQPTLSSFLKPVTQ